MRAACLALVLCACGNPNTLTLSSAEASVDVTLEPFHFTVKNADGAVLLDSQNGTEAYGTFAQTVDRPTTRAQILPGWDNQFPNEGAWVRGGAAKLINRSESSVTVQWAIEGGTTELTLSLDHAKLRLETKGDFTADAPRYNKSTLAFALPADEHFFGLGERFGTFDHRGWSLYSWPEEGPLGGGEGVPTGPENPYPHGPSMTYFPVPFFLSNRGYGLHVDSTYRSELHLGSERSDAWRVAVNTTGFALTVYVGTPVEVLDAFTADTGRPLIPAPWVFGPRRRISPGDTVDGGAQWRVMRDRKMPLTGIDDAVHFLPALSQTGREDELHTWVDALHAAGFKVMAYNNPFVAQNHPNAAADYAYGAEHHYFVEEADGGAPALGFLISGTPLYVAMIDFTNDAASAWYRGLLQRTVDFGYDGWMHDFGEYVPRTGTFADGRRGDALHNPYPMLSAKEARAVLQASKPDDHLFFVRAGYTGSQAFVPAVWGGDAETSFDETQGIPSTIRSGLNLSLTGVPYWGSDGTGFKCIGDSVRDKEVYVRWLELEAVSPIMMDQNACSNPLGARSKWTLWSDVETQDIYRQMASLHTRLEPYFMTLAREANRSGLPLMRAPFLFQPNEPRTWTLDDTFFLGPALYAAPVLERGQTTRTVWFPAGARYVAWDDQTVFAAGEHQVAAPLNRLPLFLVENQLVPLLDQDVQTLAPASEPDVISARDRADVLDVRVALGPASTATLTLLDGTVLTASRTTGTSREGFTEGDPRSCARCFQVGRAGDVDRVQVSSGRSSDAVVRFDDLELRASGGPPRTIRWDVWKL